MCGRWEQQWQNCLWSLMRVLRGARLQLAGSSCPHPNLQCWVPDLAGASEMEDREGLKDFNIIL